MALYAFEAKTLEGKRIRGNIGSESVEQAKEEIRKKGLIVQKIGVVGTTKSVSKNNSQRTISLHNLRTFIKQFAVLINSGIPIVQALQSLAEGSETNVKIILTEMAADLEKGSTLNQSMSKFPKAFNTIAVNLVKAGEEGGVLDLTLKRLSEYVEKSMAIRGKIKKAMIYPVAILCLTFIIVTGLLVFVVPEFEDVFKSAGAELPALTQLIVDLSHNIYSQWPFYLGVTILTPTGFIYYYKSEAGRAICDRIFLSVPVFGTIIQKSAIAMFSRTLSTMLSSGVRIMDACELAGSTCGNYVIEKVLMDCREAIEKGGTLTKVFRDSPHIPMIVSQMVAAGEATGNLDSMLDKVAEFYEQEVVDATDSLSALIEPVVMVVIGGIVGVFVIGMYLPIFQLSSAAAGGI